MKNHFTTILNCRYKTPQDVADCVQRLGNQLMRKGSQGYDKFGAIPIIDAARAQANQFSQSYCLNTAITLMDVVLSANRNHEKQVKPHIERLRQGDYGKLTLSELKTLIAESVYHQFIWHHADEKKFLLLKELVDAFLSLPTPTGCTDYERLKSWAESASLSNRREDPIGRIRNFGIASFQHLRIAFGVPTVKPDKRVKQVLKIEFGARLNDEHAIAAVEEIAKYVEVEPILIDQIFVKYGSGYYKNRLDTSCSTAPC